MILTPLQLALIITLILIVCGTVTWLITMHQRDQANDRINHLADRLDALQYRMHRIEHPKGVRIQDGAITNLKMSHEDVLAAWEDVINTTRRQGRI